MHLINPPAHRGVAMVREGRCMQRAGAWTAVWAPISLATIAAVLREDGDECRLDDCIIEGVSKEQMLDRIRSFRPDLVVLNTATPSIVSDLALADAIKRELPEARIVAIGIHVTALPHESLRDSPGLDAVVRGEPELTVRDLASAQRSGGSWENVPGAAVRAGDGVIDGPEREPAVLDELPFPAWDLVRTELYRLPFSGRPFLLAGTSRGCPFHCEFCADPTYYGHALRLKSPERIVAELRHVRDAHGTREFLFWSESFTLKRAWTASVLEAILAADLGVRFVANSRVDHVDPELLGLMRRAGCWMIGYGLESGSERTLRLMNKSITLEQSGNAVRWAKAAGLDVTAHLVMGYPGETEADLKATMDFACSLPLDFAQFYCAVPFPGSALHQRASSEGWIESAPWERFEQNQAIISTPELPAAVVEAWRRRAYRRFYSRPGRAFSILTRHVGLAGAPTFLKMMLSFGEWI